MGVGSWRKSALIWDVVVMMDLIGIDDVNILLI